METAESLMQKASFQNSPVGLLQNGGAHDGLWCISLVYISTIGHQARRHALRAPDSRHVSELSKLVEEGAGTVPLSEAAQQGGKD